MAKLYLSLQFRPAVKAAYRDLESNHGSDTFTRTFIPIYLRSHETIPRKEGSSVSRRWGHRSKICSLDRTNKILSILERPLLLELASRWETSDSPSLFLSFCSFTLLSHSFLFFRRTTRPLFVSLREQS